MDRRKFTQTLALTGLGVSASAWAQTPFTEGRDFVRLSTPVATSTPGKIDVIEFFWYGCPHCNSFEPMLDAWVHKLPADVVFRRVPVSFTAMHELHARMFYALEATGLLETLHRRVFAAMHVQRRRLDKEADILAFVAEQGGDRAKFADAMKSFGVATKLRQARSLSDGYKIDGVPALGVHGRFYTSGSLANGLERSLVVSDHLIQLARKAR